MINKRGFPFIYQPLVSLLFYTISQFAFIYIRLLTRQPTLQVDSFATARGGEIHEATRRILSVLLRQVKLNFQEVLVLGKINRLASLFKT